MISWRGMGFDSTICNQRVSTFYSRLDSSNGIYHLLRKANIRLALSSNSWTFHLDRSNRLRSERTCYYESQGENDKWGGNDLNYWLWNYNDERFCILCLKFESSRESVQLPSCFPRILLWRHNGRERVSNHQPHQCLINLLFRNRSTKTSKLRVTGLRGGNSPVTDEFPAQMASNAENVSIWWHDHAHECDHWKLIGHQFSSRRSFYLLVLKTDLL